MTAGIAERTPLRVRLAWITALSFASGFPFGLVNEAIPIYLRTRGTSLLEIGLVSAVTFPWTFKFLWSPLVDRVGTRRYWIAGCLLGLAFLIAMLAATDPVSSGRLFWALLLGVVILSATQDIAIDAFTIEVTTTRELGVANSARIAAYRAAMLASGGLLVWLAGRMDWAASFAVGAVVCGVLALLALTTPSLRREVPKSEPIWEPIRALLSRPEIGWVIAFALLFKLGDAAMEPMTRPFWVDRGLSLAEIGAVLTTGRMIATVSGAVLGGIVATRWGIIPALWSLGIVQAVSNLGYWAAASLPPSTAAVVGAALFENFCGGLGTAAFVAFLMSVCERRYAATHYALLSALLALTRVIAGAASGGLAERLGYARYFFLTFLLALPAYALLPRVRRAVRKEDGAEGGMASA